MLLSLSTVAPCLYFFNMSVFSEFLAIISFLLLVTPTIATGKRGLAYSDANLANDFVDYSSITWGYNWGYPAHGLSDNLEFVPMLWGNPTGNTDYINNWKAAVASAIKNGSTHLLSFNEPDLNGISPKDAATAYMTFVEPFHAQNMSLGAPAVTNGGAPTGLTWLEQFFGNCTQCTIDFVPIHWYDNWDQTAYFAQYVEEAHGVVGNRSLWITEFEGKSNVDEEQVSFINTVVPWLDSLDYVERYSYFGVFSGLLINDAGSGLSDIGQAFAKITAVNSTTPTSPVGSLL